MKTIKLTLSDADAFRVESLAKLVDTDAPTLARWLLVRNIGPMLPEDFVREWWGDLEDRTLNQPQHLLADDFLFGLKKLRGRKSLRETALRVEAAEKYAAQREWREQAATVLESEPAQM